MRIVFLGLPLAALLLLHDDCTVALAGLRTGLTLGARRLVRRIGQDNVVLDPQLDWPSFVARIEALRPDLLVSWFFTQKIPMSAVHPCRLGGLGVHPSLLPRHRGPDPFFAAIDAGDATTGVTVHKIAADYDTGAILAQQALPIDPSWNAWQLARKLDRPSLEALRSVVRRAAEGDDLRGEPQDESGATSAPQPGQDECVIRWNDPAERITRRVRALAPVPGAQICLGQETLTLLRASIFERVPRVLEPGEATVVDGMAVVRTGDSGVALIEAERDGEILEASELAMLVACETQK